MPDIFFKLSGKIYVQKRGTIMNKFLAGALIAGAVVTVGAVVKHILADNSADDYDDFDEDDFYDEDEDDINFDISESEDSSDENDENNETSETVSDEKETTSEEETVATDIPVESEDDIND